MRLCHLWPQLTENSDALTVSQPSPDTILLYPKDDICFLNAGPQIISYYPFSLMLFQHQHPQLLHDERPLCSLQRWILHFSFDVEL